LSGKTFETTLWGNYSRKGLCKPGGRGQFSLAQGGIVRKQEKWGGGGGGVQSHVKEERGKHKLKNEGRGHATKGGKWSVGGGHTQSPKKRWATR